MIAFLAGYAGLWMLAGAVLVSFALTIRLGFGAQLHGALALCALAGALVWQASPVKQYALNQCHRLPAVAGFAPQAYWGAFAYGLRHGGWCVLSCWAVMFAALLVPVGHVAMMLVASLWIWAERLDPPVRRGCGLRMPRAGLRLAWRAVTGARRWLCRAAV